MKAKLLIHLLFLCMSITGYPQINIVGKYSNGRQVNRDDIFLLNESCIFHLEDETGKIISSNDCTWSLKYLTNESVYQTERSVEKTNEFNLLLDTVNLNREILSKIKIANNRSNYFKAQIECCYQDQLLIFPIYANLLPSDPPIIEILDIQINSKEETGSINLRIHHTERADYYRIIIEEKSFNPPRRWSSDYFCSIENAENYHYYWNFLEDEIYIKIYAVNTFGISEIITYNFHELATSTSIPTTNSQLSFYPNPVKDILYMHGDITEIKSILIFNPAGKMIYSINSPQNTTIDLSNLPIGNYIINVQHKSKQKNEIFKLIKSNN